MEPLNDWRGKSNIHQWHHVIEEAWSVGGASTSRHFRHLNVRHTSEPVRVDYCSRNLGGEHACMYGAAVKQLVGVKNFAYALPGLK